MAVNFQMLYDCVMNMEPEDPIPSRYNWGNKPEVSSPALAREFIYFILLSLL
jgi:hypothetical protein